MKRIRLGNDVFEGQNNAYLLDGETTALIDTGVAMPGVRATLAGGLADAGLDVADLDEIYLTHWHPDHAGLAGDLQADSGADVYVHEADAPLVSGEEPLFFEDEAAQERVFDDWGMPADAREELRNFAGGDDHGLTGRMPDVIPFSDGERFEVNGVGLEAVHLPGHSAGLTAFAFDASSMAASLEAASGNSEAEALLDDGGMQAFVGDAILPKYTPNVGGADVRVDDPLEKYAESLVRIVERDWERAHPGHRDAIDHPSRRAAVILEHHRERTERVVDVLAEHGPADAWTVSAHLFGDLHTIHILHGPGEAYAHLDHLEDAGVVARDGIEYELVEPAAAVDVDALFPETRFYGTVEGETEGE
ncbi:MBL fold metallo-hydrolase [Haloparvum sp. AD34]